MKSTSRVPRGLRPLLWAPIAVLLGVPGYAEQAEDCPTWFPDVRCERSGRYEGFVRPLSHPFIFEDPFITTGVYSVGIYHEFPGDSVFKGGNAWAVAVQARIAITDRLAFIATKDGHMWIRPDNDSVVDADNGWFNLSGGLKYALIDMPEENFILSPSLRFEVPTGSDSIFQGRGKGAAIPTISAAWAPPKQDILHLISDLGFQAPFTNDQSQQMFYHLHSSFNFVDFFTPFAELNILHYLTGGDGNQGVKLRSRARPPKSLSLTDAQNALASQTEDRRFEGNDVLNLGSEGMGGKTYVSMALGVYVPITKNWSFSGAWEKPVSNRRDITKQRGTISISYEF